MNQPIAGSRLSVVSQTVGVLSGAVIYLLALFPDGFRPGRTAVAMGYTSNFFDQQARALMQGRLNLPKDSLGIEAFVVDGVTFMYFPPFPAVLRIPVLWATDEFDGRLTVVSMLLAWIVLTVSSVALWRSARAAVRGDAPMTKLEAVITAASLAFITGGTTMTFNASLPWVYHEVYSWAIALAVASAYWLMRVHGDPRRPFIVLFGVCTTLTIMTRTPTGLGLVCGGLLLTFAWWLRRKQPGATLRDLTAASLVPLGLSVALNLAKFGHPFLFPLESQVWTQESAQRRAALEANDGSLTGLQFFTTSFMNYISPTGIRFTEHFPYITLPPERAQAFDGAFLDQSYRTGSITAFMFWGCLMLLVALIGLVVLRRNRLAAGFGAPIVWTILITAGVMSYGYIANRYTSDFVPALIVGTAFGTPLFVTWLSRRRWSVIRTGGAVLAVGAVAFSLAAQTATSQWMWAVTHRGAPLIEYVNHQARLSTDSALSKLVTTGTFLPRESFTDELTIVGDCDGLYLATGDEYEPWVTVEARDQVALVVAGRKVRPFQIIDLFEVRTTRSHVVQLQTSGDGKKARLLTRVAGEVPMRGNWFLFLPGDRVRVAVRMLPDYGIAQVESTPGGFASFLPATEWTEDWYAYPGRITLLGHQFDLGTYGLSIREADGPEPRLCRSLQALAEDR